MLLVDLLQALPGAEVQGEAEGIEISSIRDDSRQVEPGDLFVAVKGEHTDGHAHIGEAIERGAVAVILQEAKPLERVAAVRVPDTVDALARVSAAFWGYPSRELTTVGITGTNGKTTVSLLIQSILKAAGRPAGLIGTLRYEVGGKTLPAPNTTPRSLQVQQLLHRMKETGMTAAVLEVSSHALAIGRVRECCFDLRVFTNLTRDHLDFHETMENYYHAKAELFTETYVKEETVSLINVDDPWGRRLVQETKGEVRTFALYEKADFQVEQFHNTIDGLTLTVKTPVGTIAIESTLSGSYNVANLLAAVAAGVTLGLPAKILQEGIAGLSVVPGRFEKISGAGFTVVVDYAHTDDALRNLLKTVREVCRGRVITVFGCGGDRDRGKRPLMGAVAARLSDRVIVTSDNPRTEDPGAILGEILTGIGEDRRSAVEVIGDRREAIRQGVSSAEAGDIVVVAGKGHEDYQIIGEKRFHFDDREEVRKVIAQDYGCRFTL
ncbi:MAG: UDP-N-acetylmuramoyl-L-alanyl-D-glutamate--2,6-diaminopimelate ligase [Deltaproteobacteria bacterium]|nr:UDP-N-acetylmuramoyl-L-alanyl-D-glutamate--2,6-diaminopimelate ligase [Deltaproteobacteria bacterium]